jgi:hypothetical protein
MWSEFSVYNSTSSLIADELTQKLSIGPYLMSFGQRLLTARYYNHMILSLRLIAGLKSTDKIVVIVEAYGMIPQETC